jgi:formate dehydrogenase subunit delta
METTDRVTREINLIARNFECLGDETASSATADHVRRFWAPLLKAALRSAFGAQPDQFSPIALQAIAALEHQSVAASAD